MTWGEQVDNAAANEMLNVAFDDFGINFIDTSELYPMPADPTTFGAADRIIGKWLKGRPRGDVVLATKVAGYSNEITWARKFGAGTTITKASVQESVDASLARLGVDYIDLLQIEWPHRRTQPYTTGHEEMDAREEFSIAEQLEALDSVVRQGKVRHIGLCNETPYGVLKFMEAAGKSLPTVSSLQNAYNLLERNAFETNLLEVCHYSKTGFLAHSPLAGGALSGKYAKGGATGASRLLRYPGFTARYLLPSVNEAVLDYGVVAEKYGLTLAQLSLAWCYTRPFVTSTVIGASSVAQLKDNLFALNCPITNEMEEDIAALYRNKHREPTQGFVAV
jgi:aryl-alcohol dehydrogenase-like predicted oxidoreductase